MTKSISKFYAEQRLTAHWIALAERDPLLRYTLPLEEYIKQNAAFIARHNLLRGYATHAETKEV